MRVIWLLKVCIQIKVEVVKKCINVGVVFTPKFVELTSIELNQNLEKLREAGVGFPLGKYITVKFLHSIDPVT